MARRKGLWTEGEEDILLAMFAAGDTVKDIAKALGRSQEAVGQRRLRLKAQAEYGG